MTKEIKIKQILDPLFANTTFDKKMVLNLLKFENNYISLNEEHISFFSTKLMGIYTIRFPLYLIDELFEEILLVNYNEVNNALKHATNIDQNRNVISETYNVVCVYVAHRFIISNLPKNDAVTGATIILNLMQYRFMSGFLRSFFPYPISESTAQAIYANLTYKYIIKKVNNWKDFFTYRSNHVLETHDKQYNYLELFTDDIEVLKIITDLYTRVKSTMKNIYSEFIKVHRSGEKILTSKEIDIDINGEEVLKDKINGLHIYVGYILSISQDPHSLIRNELIKIIQNLMPNLNPKHLITILNYISVQTTHNLSKEVESFITLAITHSYNYMLSIENIIVDMRDIGLLLATIRGAYNSSKSQNPDLLKLRAEGEKIIKYGLRIHDKAIIATVRTSLLLYLNLRTYSMKYYN